MALCCSSAPREAVGQGLHGAVVHIGQAGQQLVCGVIHGDGLARGQIQRAAGRALGHARQPQRRLLVHIRPRPQEVGDGLLGPRAEGQAPAARTDGGQQAAGRMGDQEQDPAFGRLFKGLQQGIGGVGIHVVDRIHDRHPPRRRARGFGKELRQAPGVVHRDHLALFAVLADPFQHHQVGMGMGDDLAADRAVGLGAEQAVGWIGRRRAPNSRRAVR